MPRAFSFLSSPSSSANAFLLLGGTIVRSKWRYHFKQRPRKKNKCSLFAHLTWNKRRGSSKEKWAKGLLEGGERGRLSPSFSTFPYLNTSLSFLLPGRRRRKGLFEGGKRAASKFPLWNCTDEERTGHFYFLLLYGINQWHYSYFKLLLGTFVSFF